MNIPGLAAAAPAATAVVPTSQPAPTPAPVPTAALSESDIHKARLREFFAECRPDNVSKADELFDKLGTAIWAGLEKKYPGKTAKYTAVGHCVPLLAVFS